MVSTPSCRKECQSGYTLSYQDDKHYGKKVYSVKGERKMMTEIYNNGPVEGTISVYADFVNYKSGE